MPGKSDSQGPRLMCRPSSGRHHSLTDPRVTRAGISAGEDLCPLTCHSPALGPSATLQDRSQPVSWAGPCQAAAGASRRAHATPPHTLGGVTQVDGRTQCFDRPQDETEAATSELGTKAGSGETEA